MNLRKTALFAYHAHKGVKDGVDYWAHPSRVMAHLGPQATFLEMQSALLHDVLEDTAHTAESLRAAGFSAEVVEIVSLLTRDKSITYWNYIQRIIDSGNKVAMRVKLADIADHLDPRRADTLSDSLRKRYVNAQGRLQVAV